jgi:hypothetical protein
MKASSFAVQSRGAAAVKRTVRCKLSRKVLKLPGSIWREDIPVVKHRQANCHSISVTICGRLCNSALLDFHEVNCDPAPERRWRTGNFLSVERSRRRSNDNWTALFRPGERVR